MQGSACSSKSAIKERVAIQSLSLEKLLPLEVEGGVLGCFFRPACRASTGVKRKGRVALSVFVEQGQAIFDQEGRSFM